MKKAILLYNFFVIYLVSLSTVYCIYELNLLLKFWSHDQSRATEKCEQVRSSAGDTCDDHE